MSRTVPASPSAWRSALGVRQRDTADTLRARRSRRRTQLEVRERTRLTIDPQADRTALRAEPLDHERRLRGAVDEHPYRRRDDLDARVEPSGGIRHRRDRRLVDSRRARAQRLPRSFRPRDVLHGVTRLDRICRAKAKRPEVDRFVAVRIREAECDTDEARL